MIIDIAYVYLIIIFLMPGFISILVSTFISSAKTSKGDYTRLLLYFLHSIIILFISYFLLSSVGSLFFNEELLIMNFLEVPSVSVCLFIFFISIVWGVIHAVLTTPYLPLLFKPISKKICSDSIYGELAKDFLKVPTLLTAFMKDGSILQGRISLFDSDEEKRNYIFHLASTIKIRDNQKFKLGSVVLDITDTSYVKFDKL